MASKNENEPPEPISESKPTEPQYETQITVEVEVSSSKIDDEFTDEDIGKKDIIGPEGSDLSKIMSVSVSNMGSNISSYTEIWKESSVGSILESKTTSLLIPRNISDNHLKRDVKKLGNKKVARWLVWYHENRICILVLFGILISVGVFVLGYFYFIPTILRIIEKEYDEPKCVGVNLGPNKTEMRFQLKSNLLDLASAECGGKIHGTRNTQECAGNCSSTANYWVVDCSPKPSILLQNKGDSSWCFTGQVGRVIIQFRKLTRIRSFEVFHQNTTHDDDLPGDFKVLGYDYLENENPSVLGTYTYNTSGPTEQKFRAKINHLRGLKFVEFIFRNQDENKVTRIHRIRVMGVFNPKDSKL